MKKFVSVIMALIMIAVLYVPVKAEDQQVTKTEYLEVEPGAYIDIEISCDDPYVVMDVCMTGGNGYYFGAFDVIIEKYKQNLHGYGMKYNDGLYADYDMHEERSYYSINYGMAHTIKFDKHCAQLGSLTFSDYEKDLSGINSNIYLFAYNVDGSPRFMDNQDKIKFYSCRIYDGGTLVRDYVPAKRGNEAGVLDRCENKFYGNKGNGKMTTNSEQVRDCIVGRENVNFAEYAVVGKNVYFDTEYFPDFPTKIVMNIDADNSNGSLFGTKRETANEYYDDEEHMYFCRYIFYEYLLKKSGNTIAAGNGNASGKEFSKDFSSGRHTFEYGQNGVIIDGENVCEYEQRPIVTPPSLYLFATHVREYAVRDEVNPKDIFIDHPIDADDDIVFYSCQIYEGDTLVHDYVPAVLKSDGTPVIFDKVAETSYRYSGAVSNVTSVNVSEDGGYSASAFGDGNVMVIIILMIIIIGCGAAFVLYETKSRS